MCIYVYKLCEKNSDSKRSSKLVHHTHLCHVSHMFNESSLPDLGLKCAGHISDGRSSGVKFKLPWSLVVFPGWSLMRGHL